MDAAVVGVVGPASSSVTEIAGPIFDQAGLTYVSPSATAVSLTDGHLKHFFRVVANNNSQAQAIIRLVRLSLHPKTVLAVDDREVYSTNLIKIISRRASTETHDRRTCVGRCRPVGLRERHPRDRTVNERRSDAVGQSA